MKEFEQIGQSIAASIKSDTVSLPKDRYKDLMRKEELLRLFKIKIDNEFLRV